MEADWRTEPEKTQGSYWKYYEDRFVDVHGVKTRYWSEGGGEGTVLLIHGYGGAVEEWAWNIPSLAARYRVVALDIPGFGMADKPDAEYSYEFFAAFVKDFMEVMGLRGAHVMGHSMGGAIAINLALRHPGAARSLTLVAPAFGTKYLPAFHLLSAPLLGDLMFKPPADHQAVQDSWRPLTYEYFKYADETIRRHYGFQHRPDYARVSLKYMRTYMTPIGFTRRAWDLFGYYRENLPRLALPVFLCWGPQDKVVDFSASAELRTLIPHAEFWSPEPCGHCPHFEYPEEFNAKALDFLGRSQGPRGAAS